MSYEKVLKELRKKGYYFCDEIDDQLLHGPYSSPKGQAASIRMQSKVRLFRHLYAKVLRRGKEEKRAKIWQTKETLQQIYDVCQSVSYLPGDIAEVGTYNAGVGLALALGCPHKNVYLFDTFENFPMNDVDIETEAYVLNESLVRTSIEKVKRLVKGIGNTVLVQGHFPESASPFEGHKFCYVHSDVDIYKSTLETIEFFYPRLAEGGIMAFHDWNHSELPGIQKSVREYFASRPDLIKQIEDNAAKGYVSPWFKK